MCFECKFRRKIKGRETRHLINSVLGVLRSLKNTVSPEACNTVNMLGNEFGWNSMAVIGAIFGSVSLYGQLPHGPPAVVFFDRASGF